VLLEVGGQIGRGGVGVVATDGVQDGHAVTRELLGRDLQRILAFLDQAALHTVLHVGQLDAAVLDGAAAVTVEHVRAGANLGRDRHALAEQQPLVAAEVADDLDLGRELRVTLDEPAHGGRQARRQAACGQDRDFLLSFAHDVTFRNEPRDYRQMRAWGNGNRPRNRGAAAWTCLETEL
jgi:hypothetical protein